MKEWHRTVVLLLLIATAVGFIFFMNHLYTADF